MKTQTTTPAQRYAIFRAGIEPELQRLRHSAGWDLAPLSEHGRRGEEAKTGRPSTITNHHHDKRKIAKHGR